MTTRTLGLLSALALIACTEKGDTGAAAGPSAASVSWGASSVSLTVDGGSGEYWFGMAEDTTTSTDPWTGEDCVYGYVTGTGSTLAWCHAADTSGTTLTYGGDPNNLAPGDTVFSQGYDGFVNYYLEAYVEDGYGDCWVWGSQVSYYSGIGCETVDW